MPQTILIIEVLQPLTVTRNGLRQALEEGDWLTLPVEEATALIEKAGNKIRIVSTRVIDPAARPTGDFLDTVYWQRTSGQIDGPGSINPFTSDAAGGQWFVVEHRAELVWVRREALRSKREFEQQRLVRAEEPIQGAEERKRREGVQ